jgi:hypothetical protein
MVLSDLEIPPDLKIPAWLEFLVREHLVRMTRILSTRDLNSVEPRNREICRPQIYGGELRSRSICMRSKRQGARRPRVFS